MNIVGAAGELFGVHRRLEGAAQRQGRLFAQNAAVGAGVLQGQRCEAVTGPVLQPDRSAFAGAAQAVGEQDQTARAALLGQVELERQRACPPGVVQINRDAAVRWLRDVANGVAHLDLTEAIADTFAPQLGSDLGASSDEPRGW